MANGQTPEGPVPAESPCPYWQKKCSEVNANGVVGCRKLMPVMGMLPGEVAPHPIMMCQDDFIANMLGNLAQMSGPRPMPGGALNLNDILRRKTR